MKSLVAQGLAIQAANLEAEEERERLAEFDRAVGNLTEGERNWARTADDCFCPCCGRRGAIGLCHSCEASGR